MFLHLRGFLLRPLGCHQHRGEQANLAASLRHQQIGHDLLAYYREVLRLAKNYGKKDTEISHYFWVKLSFWRGEMNISMDFPWYDSLDEIAPLLEKIDSNEDGVLLSDEDMGWEAEIIAQDGFIYAREEDPETGDINILHKIPRGPLAKDCRNALERARALISWLSDNIGDDYWTKTRYPADLVAS